MKNGSGLNDTNRFSAAQLVRILWHMYDRFSLNPEYLSALTIAGKDGTLKYRFEGSDAVGRLRAKTGTLENVSSLSGYVQAVGGERFLFSVLVNDFPGRAGTVVKHIDAWGAQVASTGVSHSPLTTDGLLAQKADVVSPSDDVKTRASVYTQMAATFDRRHVALLRTAWKTEKDALLKVVLADAVFQLDAKDYMGLRMVLDSLAATQDVYNQTRQWAQGNPSLVPGVPALLEWGSAGDFEAQARVLEWARLAEAGLRLLVRGLKASNDAQHPFWPALKRAQASLNAEWAAFASQTELAMVKALTAPEAMPVPVGAR